MVADDDTVPLARDPAEIARVGLCAHCRNARVLVSGKGSRFYLCQAPAQPKYPQLPRRACADHVETDHAP